MSCNNVLARLSTSVGRGVAVVRGRWSVDNVVRSMGCYFRVVVEIVGNGFYGFCT